MFEFVEVGWPVLDYQCLQTLYKALLHLADTTGLRIIEVKSGVSTAY